MEHWINSTDEFAKMLMTSHNTRENDKCTLISAILLTVILILKIASQYFKVVCISAYIYVVTTES